MENSDDPNKSRVDFRLSKNEILRGYNSFNKVLQNSTQVSTEFLKAFVSKHPAEIIISDFSKSPLFTGKVKVGFIIAKKKIRKAFFRNRIKRLLRESYRLNKGQTGLFNLDLTIIFTFTEKGYALFKKDTQIKIGVVNSEMILISLKIKQKFTAQ